MNLVVLVVVGGFRQLTYCPATKSFMVQRNQLFLLNKKTSLKKKESDKHGPVFHFFSTWRIIPVCKWLITMVSKSPKWGYSPYK